MNKENLRKYAELVAKVGINVKKEDGIFLYCNIDSIEFVRELVKVLYREGAKNVITRISDDEVSLARFEEGHDYIFDLEEKFEAQYLDSALASNYHRMAIVSPNPELYKNVDSTKIRRQGMASFSTRQVIDKYMDQGTLKWVVAAIPSIPWAKMVFPDLSDDEALEKLWDLVFKVTRTDNEDPVKAWIDHDNFLKEKEKWLDEQHFEKLIYEGPGTDLEVYLPKEHKWIGGSSETPSGVKYMANIPTEEIFTVPHSHKVNGTLKATKPLAVNGKIVDGMSFVFKDGEIVEFKAEKNEEVFKDLMNMDEGAKRLGEVAIVPNSSPISNTGVLFNNTLFDENASCHFAIGNSYTETVIGGTDMDDEKKAQIGANKSRVHTDFMVGGPNLNITGVKSDGTKVKVLVNGEWEF